MVNFWKNLFGLGAPKDSSVPVISIDALSPMDPFAQNIYQDYDGAKYPTGFGDTKLFNLDYWQLRSKSSQLFTENLYARGLLRRLVTNIINTGLTPECIPEESILGLEDEALQPWAENVETLYQLYGNQPERIDYTGKNTDGGLQEAIKLESLIAGDVLVVIRQDPNTKMPQVQLVGGDRIRTPLEYNIRKGHKIVHGVELDSEGRQVAYWYQPEQNENELTVKSIRIPSFGKRTGRRISWLVYGTDHRIDEVRGLPFLSLMLQSFKEVDRYRDAATRKATINSILAMFIKRDEVKGSSRSVSAGAQRKTTATVSDQTGERKFNIAEQIPGMVIEELNQGETPVPHSTAGTDVNFGPFEKAIVSTIAWSSQIPPTILFLSFDRNYAASQAELNEFKMFLDMERAKFAAQYLTKYYIEWLISAALNGTIQAQGLLTSWRDPDQWAEFGAWTNVEWTGSVKPTTDMLKLAKANEVIIDRGWSTNARVSREMTGTKFRKNMEKQIRENELRVKALTPMLELKAKFGEQQTEDAVAALERAITLMSDQISDLEEREN
jgi:lambda family phage portal protein